ncbi:hypothetical protein TRAPUB_8775 [Trametes pubescens]|uniref:Uncharacterized protein n=1 Tax=Trametes pubescens TaxID=154538 RepID=A0A1M2W4C6_TRAPU|nr:hypothetical protein TRAPUB_8775 [Trametes pubescens]
MSTRRADINIDLPFSIVKKTSELHRARTVAEEKLFQSRAELALLSDAVTNQVGHIEFRERL